jgi:hypothetical protein
MRFASTAVPEKESIERFVPKLRATAKAISDEFLRQHQSDPIDINMDDSEEL